MRTFVLAVCLAATSLLSAAAAQPQYESWGDMPGNDPAQLVCRRLGAPHMPAADRPNAEQAKALEHCESGKLYYGFNGKPDYAKARMCAILEYDTGDDDTFGAATVLMQVYGNGLGVRRNVDLATAYACRVNGTASERSLRVEQVQALKRKPAHIDFCDAVGSNWGLGQCKARDTALTAQEDRAQLRAVLAKASPGAQAAFSALSAAFEAFVRAHKAEVEVQLVYSGEENPEDSDEEGDVRDRFLADVKALVAGKWPNAGAAAAKAADARLNTSYREALASAARHADTSRIRPEDIRNGERAWLKLRDGWVRFAATAAPQIRSEAILAHVTERRVRELRGMVMD